MGVPVANIQPLPPVISSIYLHFINKSLDFCASVVDNPATLRILVIIKRFFVLCCQGYFGFGQEKFPQDLSPSCGNRSIDNFICHSSLSPLTAVRVRSISSIPTYTDDEAGNDNETGTIISSGCGYFLRLR